VSSGALVLRDGVAFVGPELERRPFSTLRMEDGLITGIDESVTDFDGLVLDLAGAFVVPGLIDCHVHFDLAAHPAAYGHWSASPLTRSMTCLHNGLVALSKGITTVRDLGCIDHHVLDYAGRVESGSLIGPRVIAAGRPITITGGHFAQYGRVADGQAEVRKAVREQIGAGARVVKLMATGGISSPGDPTASTLTQEEMAVAVEEAHKRGITVAAHAHNRAGILAALQAGVDSIEHAAFADDESLEAIISHQATLVPTVSALNNIAPDVGIPIETVRKSLQARQTYVESTSRAISAGVRIAAGTDAGTALNPIGGLVDELEMYCAGGMSWLEAVAAATVNAGALVGGGLGVIATGRPADVIVVDADPGEALTTLREPRHVIKGGSLVDLPWVRQTIAEVRAVAS
jgi:imidazolonepropionase-like amidohydrolase